MNAAGRQHTFRRMVSVVLSLAMVLCSMVNGNYQTVQATENGAEEHNYNTDGFCTDDGCTRPYQPITQGDGTENNPYLIGNAGQLYYFAGIVNGDDTVCMGDVSQNTAACARLTADIRLNDAEVTGKDDSLRQWNVVKEYYGVFDGDNHTISGLYYYNAHNTENSASYLGLFGKLYGTCRNVGIVNSYIYTTGDEVGSIAGFVEDGTIENCYSMACLYVCNSGASAVGGLAGKLVCSKGYPTVRNSYYFGTIQGTLKKEYCGDVAGIHSYIFADKEIAESRENVVNCYYYVSGVAVSVTRKGAEERTPDQFASGQVAYELNGDQSEIVFGQTVSGEGVRAEDVQSFPVLGGQQVARNGQKGCPGCSNMKSAEYYNGTEDSMIYEYPEHHYDISGDDPEQCLECGQVPLEHTCRYKNGFCKYCGSYEIPEGKGTMGEPYLIGNAGQLYYFAGIVNGDDTVCTGNVSRNMAACARLTADIILNEGTVNGPDDSLKKWTMIMYYMGVFDGDNHTISGIYINEQFQNAIGLFGSMGGICKNIGIENSYICTPGKNIYVGSIAGELKGGKIENCYSTAHLNIDNAAYGGGLVGRITEGTSGMSVVKNSYYAGVVDCGMEQESCFGGITGYSSYSSIKKKGSFMGTCENCYYYVSGMAVSVTREGVMARTPEQFESGQVAYELNAGRNNTVFGQTLSGDGVSVESVQALPVLGGQRVCAGGHLPCPGSDKNLLTYHNGKSDSITYEYPAHHYGAKAENPYQCLECGQIGKHTCNYDENGFCIYCAAYEPPEGEGTEDSPYLIGNAGQLYFFAGIVNGDEKIGAKGNVQYNCSASNAHLTADIVLNEGVVNAPDDSLMEWTVMKNYTGTFDGEGHMISGLYVIAAGNRGGFIGTLNGGTCKNVGIVNSYINSGKESYIGSIAGVLDGGTIENCYSTAYMGIDGASYAGGLAGRIESGTVRNSYYAGTADGTLGRDGSAFGGIVCIGAMGTCENCYYFVSGAAAYAVMDGVEGRTLEQFTSGQVAYELNGDQSKIIFGQTLSAEAVSREDVQTLPVLGGRQVYASIRRICPGVKDDTSGNIQEQKYSNDKEMEIYTYADHVYDSDGDDIDDVYKCTYCGKIKEHEHMFTDGLTCELCGCYDEPEGNGTKGQPYRIGSAAQLRWFMRKLNEAHEQGRSMSANVVLTEDIRLNPEGVTAGAADAYYEDTIVTYPKGAVFDGQGHTIHGLCYNYKYNENACSAFVNENEGTICDVSFAGVSAVVGSRDEELVNTWGTLIYVNDGTLSGIRAEGVITGRNATVGGICCHSTGDVTGCVNYINITLEGACSSGGGIVNGFNNNNSYIHNCINYGDINVVSGSCAGIACIVNKGTIANCVNEGNISGNDGVAGIVVDINNNTITKCINSGQVTASFEYAGGIAGSCGNGSVTYCFNNGDVRGCGTCPYRNVGGILGTNKNGTLKNCYYAEGSAESGVGFLCLDCSSHESLQKTCLQEEGIVRLENEAFMDSEIVWSLNNDAGENWLSITEEGKVVTISSGIPGHFVARKAVFACSGCTEPVSVEYIMDGEDLNTYKYRIHNYDAVTLTCTECGKVIPHLCVYGEDGYCKFCGQIRSPEGKGTQEEPYEIGNAAELYYFAGIVNGDEKICKDGVSRNTGACAVLTDDIVINSDVLSEETTDADVWVPAGSLPVFYRYDINAYCGCFDGQGHTITGIYIPETSDEYTGFFGSISADARILDLNLENVWIGGNRYAGGICGYTNKHAHIEGCRVAGVISAMEYAGGIAGRLDSDANLLSVQGCCNMARITAEHAGGIVSRVDRGCIMGCYSAGTVTGMTDTVNNGIIGEIATTDEEEDVDLYTGEPVVVDGCYYLADDAAGEMPEGYGEPASETEFASGACGYKMNVVLQQNKCSGTYGQILTGEKKQNFPVWREKSKVYPVGTASCPGVAVLDVKGYANDNTGLSYVYAEHLYEDGSYYCAFCGTMKEHACEYENGYCKYCSNYRKPAGEGTKEKPYQIGSAAELLWFRDMVSGDLKNVEADAAACAVLTADIDIGAYAGTQETNWIPIGLSKNDDDTTAYLGTFDGQGHALSGMVQMTGKAENIGVFHEIGEGAAVYNLHVNQAEQVFHVDSDVLAEVGIDGVFCYANSGIVSGCSVETGLEIDGMVNYVAGFTMYNEGTIANSSISGTIRGEEEGYTTICGMCYSNAGLLVGCANEVKLHGDIVSGICSENAGTIEACENRGEVTGSEYAAGICRYNDGTIEKCENRGKVTGSGYAAGICYYNGGTIEKCENRGELTGSVNAVGICYYNDGTIEKCENRDELTSSVNAVGICYYNDGTITMCRNSGKLAGGESAVGISDSNRGTIEACENRGKATCAEIAVGICFTNFEDGNIRNCVNHSAICSSNFYESYGICRSNEGRLEYCVNEGEAHYGIVRECLTGDVLVSCYSMENKCDTLYESVSGGFVYDCEILSENDFMSGRVTYHLNHAQGEEVFGQRLQVEDESGMPLLSPDEVDECPVIGGEYVYPQLHVKCPGCSTSDARYYEITGYSNTSGTVTYEHPEHYYRNENGTADSEFCLYCRCAKEGHVCTYDNGICTGCGWFEVPKGDGTPEHPYEIGNAGELCYFAYVMDGASVAGNAMTCNASACAVLTADIDLANVPAVPEEAVIRVSGSSLEWQPAGSIYGTVYEGCFDGCGHTIHGLRCTEETGALFARTGKTAVVKNVMLDDCNVCGAEVAGISVTNEGTIENCMVSGQIEGCEGTSDAYKAGGISAVNKGTITSCLVLGIVSANKCSNLDRAGFICAENTAGTVANCYYVNTGKEGTEESCVSGKGMGMIDKDGMTKRLTMDDVRSGRAAWMLDTDASYEGNKGIWRQDMNASMPTLASEGAVSIYYLHTTRLDGTSQEFFVPAGADIRAYIENTPGVKWVCAGGYESVPVGTVFLGTTMDRPVIAIKEATLPTGSITIGDKSWTQLTGADGYTMRRFRGSTFTVTTGRADTKIAYYIHMADSTAEEPLTIEELTQKTFTPYDAGDKVYLDENGYVVVYVRFTNADGLTDYICTQVLAVENPYLLSVTAPQNITGVLNGTKKDAAALGLPSAVTITTEDESITSATVVWDLEHLVSGSYDSTLTTKQTFTVGGTLVLPEGVDANGISLSVQVTVTVDALQLPSPEPVVSDAPSPSSDPTASGNPAASGTPGTSEAVVKGDVDDSGKIDLKDAQLALKIALKLVKADERQTQSADVDNDGKVTLKDAQLILKYALKLIKSFD